MNIRFPLYTRILFWFFLNLVLLASVVLVLMHGQFRFGFDWMLATGADARIQAVSDIIVAELNDRPQTNWNPVLNRFDDAYRMTWEAMVVTPITDNFCLGYEYRQKKNPYRTFGTVVDNEDDWHAICLGFILSDRLTLACGWGHLGNVVNHHEDGMWGFQFKYEF